MFSLFAVGKYFGSSFSTKIRSRSKLVSIRGDLKFACTPNCTYFVLFFPTTADFVNPPRVTWRCETVEAGGSA